MLHILRIIYQLVYNFLWDEASNWKMASCVGRWLGYRCLLTWKFVVFFIYYHFLLTAHAFQKKTTRLECFSENIFLIISRFLKSVRLFEESRSNLFQEKDYTRGRVQMYKKYFAAKSSSWLLPFSFGVGRKTMIKR